MNGRPGNQTPSQILKLNGQESRFRRDYLATEEPMEIRVIAGGETRTVAITMRTPGNDFELAAGFLYGEGVIHHPDDVTIIGYCTDLQPHDDQRYNIVNVGLRSGIVPDFSPLDRHFFTNSSCGVCGKASLDALELGDPPSINVGPVVPVDVLYGLPHLLRDAQGVYERTGGLHAAGLFDSTGNLIAIREDVGRHNALDKLIGWALLETALPLSEHILMVSGRTSYELMQKSLAAGIPIVAAVSAPSSLAVSVARKFDITLIGFLRDERCNVYSGFQRIVVEPTQTAGDDRHVNSGKNHDRVG